MALTSVNNTIITITGGNYFRFNLVFIKISNQTEFFIKKNQNRTETGSN